MNRSQLEVWVLVAWMSGNALLAALVGYVAYQGNMSLQSVVTVAFNVFAALNFVTMIIYSLLSLLYLGRMR